MFGRKNFKEDIFRLKMNEEYILKEVSEIDKAMKVVKRNKVNLLESLALLDNEKINRLVDETIPTLFSLQNKFFNLKKTLGMVAASRYDLIIDKIQKEIAEHIKEYNYYKSLGFTNSLAE